MQATAPVLAQNVRVIVSLCKSGSTALIHSLSHAPGVTCYLQTVKSGQRTRGEPDYSVYYSDHPGVVLSKETIGHSTVEDCTLRVFPCDRAMRLAAPVFLFRDPVDTWASWARAGWGTLEHFELAYRHVLALYRRAAELGCPATAVRYEAFGHDRVVAFRGLCRALGIRYTAEMIDWRLRFPDQSPVIWRDDVQADFARGMSDSARASRGFVFRRTGFRLPGRDEARVNRLFRTDYEALPASFEAISARRVITGEASS